MLETYQPTPDEKFIRNSRQARLSNLLYDEYLSYYSNSYGFSLDGTAQPATRRVATLASSLKNLDNTIPIRVTNRITELIVGAKLNSQCQWDAFTDRGALESALWIADTWLPQSIIHERSARRAQIVSLRKNTHWEQDSEGRYSIYTELPGGYYKDVQPIYGQLKQMQDTLAENIPLC